MVLPAATLPKLRLLGLALRTAGVTPVPDKGMLSEELEALLTIVRFPVRLPADCGEKRMLTAALWPTLRVSGRLSPLKLKPAVLRLACEMVSAEPPEFVRVVESD